uniref:Uncharacterized protein n=1 Tax=Acrobeloides nanus TaxID=290746 RepID=A0A914DLH7_9BILA
MLISSFSYSESQNTTTESQITTTADECDRKISYGKGQNECIDVFKLNDAFIDTLQKQIHTLSTSEWYTTIDKLGKLALYLKLYRRYIYWPDGRREGLKKFPDTPVPFHEDIWTNCSLVNDEIQSFVKCVEYIYRKIQESVSIMFLVDEPLDYDSLNKEIGEKFEINEENFKNYVDGSTFSFETTSQYFFCWLAMNRLSIMEKLPYCEYGPDTSYDENGKENNQSDIIKMCSRKCVRQ